MKLIAELKRRHVFRVAGLYLVVSWLIVQVAGTILPMFGAPDWLARSIVVLLAIGFIPALIFAWVFELTTQGLKREKDSDIDQSGATISGRKLDRMIIAGLALLITFLLIERFGSSENTSPKTSGPTNTFATNTPTVVALEKTVAVLPFADFSPDKNQGWFSDGLADEILNSLSHTPDLKVASRTSSFAFRDSSETLPVIAHKLGVAHILEGSVRRSGDRLRVTAQLIRASDGFHLWSDTYDGSTDDAITLQEKIAIAIAKSLNTAMDPSQLAEMLSTGTRSIPAWEHHLKAVSFWDEYQNTIEKSSYLKSFEEYNLAAKIDPTFSRAHYALALAWRSQLSPSSITFGVISSSQKEASDAFYHHIDAAITHATNPANKIRYKILKAEQKIQLIQSIQLANEWTALEPENSEAWLELTRLYTMTMQYPEAYAALKKAQKTGLHTVEFYRRYLLSAYRVAPDEVKAVVEKALLLEPDSLMLIYQAQRALLHAGEISYASALAKHYAELAGDTQRNILVQVRQACAEGRVVEANQLAAKHNQKDTSTWYLMQTLGRIKQADQLLKPYETPELLHSLMSYLEYSHFDVTQYPLLQKKLAEQGIVRPPAKPIPFACPALETK